MANEEFISGYKVVSILEDKKGRYFCSARAANLKGATKTYRPGRWVSGRGTPLFIFENLDLAQEFYKLNSPSWARQTSWCFDPKHVGMALFRCEFENRIPIDRRPLFVSWIMRDHPDTGKRMLRDYWQTGSDKALRDYDIENIYRQHGASWDKWPDGTMGCGRLRLTDLICKTVWPPP